MCAKRVPLDSLLGCHGGRGWQNEWQSMIRDRKSVRL